MAADRGSVVGDEHLDLVGPRRVDRRRRRRRTRRPRRVPRPPAAPPCGRATITACHVDEREVRRQVGPLAGGADPALVDRGGPGRARRWPGRSRSAGRSRPPPAGVPRVCRTPSTTCAAAYGGTRTSTDLPGARSASRARKCLLRSLRSAGARSCRASASATASGSAGRSRAGTMPTLYAAAAGPVCRCLARKFRRVSSERSRSSRVRAQARLAGSMRTKWSPSTSTQLGVATRGRRRGDVGLGLADRDVGVVATVDAADRDVERDLAERVHRVVVRSGRVAEERLDGAAAQAVRVGATQVEHPGLGDDPRDRDPLRLPPLEASARRRPGREVTSGRVAEGDHRRRVEPVDVGERVDAGRHVVEGLRQAAASPDPAGPTRRYSRFQAVQPSPARLLASGRPSEASYAAFQKPPWITTTTPRDGPRRGWWISGELAGVVAVGDGVGARSPEGGGQRGRPRLPHLGQRHRELAPRRSGPGRRWSRSG